MSEWRRSNYRVAVTTALVLLNLLAIGYALYQGGPQRWDYHFRQVSLITWLGSAQMLGAALLFLACFLAVSLVHLDGDEPRDRHTWLVFALGFFVLAVDQEFQLREHITAAIDRVPFEHVKAGGTATVLKVASAVVAIALVIYYRATVLSNFAMVVAFIGGFWFLLVMILGNMLVEAIGLPVWTAKVLEGSGKLLAMAMFLSGSYIALLDRLCAAQTAADLSVGGQRRQQLPIGFPDRRGPVDFWPVTEPAASAEPAPGPQSGLEPTPAAAPAPEPAAEAESPAAEPQAGMPPSESDKH